ncbi:hypothetical protein [Trichothermofontia sp.]
MPDVAVFLWPHIPVTPQGEVPDRFDRPPDWAIEILSPEQKANKVIGKLRAWILVANWDGFLIWMS